MVFFAYLPSCHTLNYFYGCIVCEDQNCIDVSDRIRLFGYEGPLAERMIAFGIESEVAGRGRR
jgi:hypothetical protein